MSSRLSLHVCLLLRLTDHFNYFSFHLSSVAMEQLDIYRSQLSETTKQNFELTSLNTSLESQLSQLKSVQSKYKDLHAQLNDLKLKTDKIPSLLAGQLVTYRYSCMRIFLEFILFII